MSRTNQPPWRTPERKFLASLSSMSETSLHRLDKLVKQGKTFDVYQVAEKMAAQDRQAREAALPEIPDELRPYWPGAEYYGELIQIDEHDLPAHTALRRRLIEKARRRQLDAVAEAPRNPRFSDTDLASVFADAMPTLPDISENEPRTRLRRRT